MKIYIDSDFKCHVSPGEGLRAVETDAFDGKQDGYIEGYRFVPTGETWVRADGETFRGEMITPWTDWQALDKAQGEYEREQYMPLRSQNTELLEAMAAMVEDVYEQDMAEIEGE